MVPAHGAVPLQFVLLLVVEVQRTHLCCLQAVAATATEAAATATTAKAHVVDIVGIDKGHRAPVVLHHGTHGTTTVAATRANAGIDVGKHTAVHAALQSEVEHRLVVAVVDARHATQVALLVVGFYAVHDRGGQVLDGRLRVAGHELLAVDEDLLHRLAIDLDGAVVVDLGTGQLLHQFLHHRALRGLIGRSIID